MLRSRAFWNGNDAVAAGVDPVDHFLEVVGDHRQIKRDVRRLDEARLESTGPTPSGSASLRLSTHSSACRSRYGGRPLSGMRRPLVARPGTWQRTHTSSALLPVSLPITRLPPCPSNHSWQFAHFVASTTLRRAVSPVTVLTTEIVWRCGSPAPLASSSPAGPPSASSRQPGTRRALVRSPRSSRALPAMPRATVRCSGSSRSASRHALRLGLALTDVVVVGRRRDAFEPSCSARKRVGQQEARPAGEVGTKRQRGERLRRARRRLPAGSRRRSSGCSTHRPSRSRSGT